MLVKETTDNSYYGNYLWWNENSNPESKYISVEREPYNYDNWGLLMFTELASTTT